MFGCGTRIASVTIHQLLGCLCCLWTVGHQTTWRTCVGAEERCFQRGHKDPASIVVLISDLISQSMFVGCALDCWKRTMTIVGIVFSLRGCHSPQADPLPESRGTQMFAAWAGRQDCLDVPWASCTMHDADVYGIILKCLRGLARMHLKRILGSVECLT